MGQKNSGEERGPIKGFMRRLRNVARAASPLLGIMAAALLFAAPAYDNAWAEETAVETAEETKDTAEAKSVTLEAIAVEANRMEEDIGRVPQSVSVIDESEIEDKEIKNIPDVIKEIPNMNTSPSHGNAVNIRGLNASMFTNNNPVVMYIDGVPYTDRWGFDATMANVERIEVLRGPQGALYGKDAIGGVINVITKTPTNVWQGRIGAEYGSFNYIETIFNVQGPVVKDKFFVSAYGQYEQDDGWIKNTYPGMDRDANSKNDRWFGGSLLYKPTDRLSARLNLSYDYVRQNWIDGYGLPGGTPLASFNRGDAEYVNFDVPSFDKTESFSQSLNLAYNFDAVNLTSVTTHRKLDIDHKYDGDYGNNSYYNGLLIFDEHKLDTWTQEFRASSNKKEGFRWVGGVYFDFEERKQGPYGMQFPTFFGNYEMNAVSCADSSTQAVFGQVMVPLIAGFELTAGGRYQRIEKEIDLNTYYLPVGGSGPPMYTMNGKKTWNVFLPRAALSYLINEHWTPYFSWSQGYMPGGFNYFATSGTVEDNSFKPERSTNYELGVKASYDRLRLAACLFRMDIRDIHVYKAVGTGMWVTSNASKAHSQGAELEATYLPINSIELSAAVGLIDAKYDDYDTGTVNFGGQRIENTPAHTVKIGIAYNHPKGFYTRTDVRNQGATCYYDDANKIFAKKGNYTVLDMKIGYRFGYWDIYAYVKNLTDEAYVTAFQSMSTVAVAGFGQPRTFGTGLRFRF
ncbi:TonB-dependent receptor [Desulfobacca acetoxidans]